MSNQRHSTWSVTINNPTSSDEENISLARQKGWKVDGQLEKGENGTPHYQLIVNSGQQRFSALKKAFPRAHIEVARNVAALQQYVHKEETREGELKQTNELYPSLQKFWDMFSEWLDESPHRRAKFVLGADARLKVFDTFVKCIILKGYVVETMAVNPQIRACVKMYGEQIIERSDVRRQTDRQTDENNVEVDIQNASSVQEVEETVSEESNSLHEEWDEE